MAGAITEVEEDKYALLEEAWSGLQVIPVRSSWRSAIGPGKPLACPPTLETPWLVSLDPMTYRDEGDADDANLYRVDLERLMFLLKPYIHSGRPGMAAVFVYAIKPDARAQFWRFIEDLGAGLDVQPTCCWMTHRGGNRNLAGLFGVGVKYSAVDLPEGVIPGND